MLEEKRKFRDQDMMSLFYSQKKDHQLMQSSAKIDRETRKGLFSSSCVSGWHKVNFMSLSQTKGIYNRDVTL